MGLGFTVLGVRVLGIWGLGFRVLGVRVLGMGSPVPLYKVSNTCTVWKARNARKEQT